MRSVWLRRPNPKFYQIYRYLDPEKITPETMEVVQETIKRGECKLEYYHKDTHKRGCGYFVIYAMWKQILALNNYYEIGKFLAPIRARVVTMDLEIKERRAELVVWHREPGKRSCGGLTGLWFAAGAIQLAEAC